MRRSYSSGQKDGPMILVMGATGTVGREVARLLREQGQEVRAATRDAERAAANAPHDGGLSYVPFDFGRHETYEPALRGVKAVFLIGGDNDYCIFGPFASPAISVASFSLPFGAGRGPCPALHAWGRSLRGLYSSRKEDSAMSFLSPVVA